MVWQVWRMSKVYRVRPAELLGIVGSPRHDAAFRAWCVDRAVFHFGMTVESAMDEAENTVRSNKKYTDKDVSSARQNVLDTYIPPPPKDPNAPIPKGKYADPAMSVARSNARR